MDDSIVISDEDKLKKITREQMIVQLCLILFGITALLLAAGWFAYSIWRIAILEKQLAMQGANQAAQIAAYSRDRTEALSRLEEGRKELEEVKKSFTAYQAQHSASVDNSIQATIVSATKSLDAIASSERITSNYSKQLLANYSVYFYRPEGLSEFQNGLIKTLGDQLRTSGFMVGSKQIGTSGYRPKNIQVRYFTDVDKPIAQNILDALVTAGMKNAALDRTSGWGYHNRVEVWLDTKSIPAKKPDG